MEAQILRVSAVMLMLGIKRTTLWRRVRNGELPAPLKLGGPKSRAVGWRRSELDAWIADRPRATGERSAGT